MKLKFGFVKVRYRGLAKNANRLFATCALVNLFMVRSEAAARSGVVSSRGLEVASTARATEPDYVRERLQGPELSLWSHSRLNRGGCSEIP